MSEKHFLSTLRTLAHLCRHELDEIEIALYDELAQSIGYPKCSEALFKVIRNRTSRDYFPSIADFKRVAQPELDDNDTAVLIADHLIAAVRSKGRYWFDQPSWKQTSHNDLLINTFGLAGFKVVMQTGSWRNFCEQADGVNIGVWRAQLRKSVEAAMTATAVEEQAPK